MSANYEVEPGASSETMLITTDSFHNLEQMSSSLEEIKSLITESYDDSTAENNLESIDDEKLSITSISTQDDDYFKDETWLKQSKHIFVLSSAGKPIYSRYGNEDKLASFFGLIQALVSFIKDVHNDTIQSIHAGNTQFVFLSKESLILVAVSRSEESVAQLTSQLNYVFNQIASVLTLNRIKKIFEQRHNYDLRRLLAGAERFIDHLLDMSEKESAFTLGAVQCLPLAATVRDSISSAIVHSCSKIKNLVFAILLARNQLITLVRMKKYYIHPGDLHLIFNLVQASESLKTAEVWTPLCLPRFDGSGFLYGHVSYLAEDCQACLLLLTVEKEAFFILSEAKQKIVEKLRRNNCLEAINESVSTKPETCAMSGFPELRHYIYKCKSTAQFYQSGLTPPYQNYCDDLSALYKRAHQRLHCSSRPLKLLFERSSKEAILAWDTKGFELYVVMEPLTEIATAITTVGHLLNWIKKREEKLFHLNAPIF